MKLKGLCASAICALLFSLAETSKSPLYISASGSLKPEELSADFAYADDSPLPAPSAGTAPAPGVAPLPGGVAPAMPDMSNMQGVPNMPTSSNMPAGSNTPAQQNAPGMPGMSGTPGMFGSSPMPGSFSGLQPNSGGSSVGAPGSGNLGGAFSPNSYATPGSLSQPSNGFAPGQQSQSAPGQPQLPGGQSLPAAVGSASPPALAGQDPLSALEDYTSRLRLAPGLTMLFPIQHGCDRNGRPLPPYSMAVQIEKRSKDCSFSFKWTMSELNATGVRAVDEAAKRNSRKVSLFYKPGEMCTLTGYTNAVRVSDAIYNNLKNGNASAIELDGPFGQAVRHAPTIPLPQNITNAGVETLPIQVDEKKVKVRAIKAVGDNPASANGFPGNWTYWILDNANFPLMLKGTGPFIWDVPIINSNGTISDAGGNKEGKRIVHDLKNKGIASTNAILFDFDSDKLKPSATPILNEVTAYLRGNAKVKIAVQGHCDNVGGMDYNMNLSRRRAKSVRQYLVNAGISAYRLTSEGYGYTKAVASNKTESGRAKNRRVVFKVTAK